MREVLFPPSWSQPGHGMHAYSIDPDTMRQTNDHQADYGHSAGRASGALQRLCGSRRRASELCGTHTAQPCAAQYSCSRATASWKVRALAPGPAPLLLAGAGTGGLGLGSRAETAGPAVLCAAPAAARQRAGVLWGAALAAAAHLPEQRHISVIVVLRSKGAVSRTGAAQALPFAHKHQAANFPYRHTECFEESLQNTLRVHSGLSRTRQGQDCGSAWLGMPLLDQALLAPAQSAGPHWPHQCTEQAAAAPALRQLAQESAQLKRPRRHDCNTFVSGGPSRQGPLHYL